MLKFLAQALFLPLIKDGVSFLYKSISNWISKKHREYKRKKKKKKFKESGDEKDLLDLESSIDK